MAQDWRMQWRWCASERKPAVTLRLPMATHCFERKPNTITARSKQHILWKLCTRVELQAPPSPASRDGACSATCDACVAHYPACTVSSADTMKVRSFSDHGLNGMCMAFLRLAEFRSVHTPTSRLNSARCYLHAHQLPGRSTQAMITSID